MVPSEVSISQAQAAGLGATVIVCSLISLVIAVLTIIAGWKIFAKAGERGWKIFIPLYNVYIQFKINWSRTAFWIFVGIAVLEGIFSSIPADSGIVKVLFSLCALALAAMDVILSLKTAKAFGKGTGFGIGLIFLPTIFSFILAFGRAQYVGPSGIPAQTA